MSTLSGPAPDPPGAAAASPPPRPALPPLPGNTRDWFRALVESAHDIITVLDPQGRILYDSPAVERVLGYRQGELVGRNAFELVHPDDLTGALRLLARTLAEPGRSGSLVFRFRHRSGTWRLLESVGSVLSTSPKPTLVVTSRRIAGRPRAKDPDLAHDGDPDDSAAASHAHLEMLERLARAAELRDDDTGRHTRRVGELAAALGEALGLRSEQVETLRLAAPLHDVGKIGIPDAVLLKPGPLDTAETRLMRSHTLLGARILAGGRSPAVRTAEQIALCHHERWDGTGYPHGLRAESIPLPARIVAVADCFDALTHDRPYRTAWPADAALAAIDGERARHFDPEVVAALLRLHPTAADG